MSGQNRGAPGRGRGRGGRGFGSRGGSFQRGGRGGSFQGGAVQKAGIKRFGGNQNKFEPNKRGRGAGGNRFSRGGGRGATKVVIEPHRHEGVFIARGKEDLLVTKNLVMGESVYGEKRISIDNDDSTKTEYRVWNPFRSKLAAGILGGLDRIYIKPNSKVLYLGAASGTTVSHVSDIVGPEGIIYAVEFSHRSGRDLISMCKKRTNVVPIIEDARHPLKYRMLVGMVDVIFSDVAQPDQARIVLINAQLYLKSGGHVVISIKANCIDSTVPAEVVFSKEVNKLREGQVKAQEQLTLEPYERDHAMVVGVYRKKKEKKTKD